MSKERDAVWNWEDERILEFSIRDKDKKLRLVHFKRNWRLGSLQYSVDCGDWRDWMSFREPMELDAWEAAHEGEMEANRLFRQQANAIINGH
jgi:hypothetical protein